MKSIYYVVHRFLLISLFFNVILLKPFLKVYAQEGSYSAEAQKILDSYSSGNLDIFKFSINNILNSNGDIVEKPAGNPSIFGRTDYGSEFLLENELSTALSIEIPAFVIKDLALDTSDEFFPVIRDGTKKMNIDFKDLYDTESGEAITPEMGFVKLISDTATSDLENLSDGEIVEFFVKPSNGYLNQHNEKNLFFIDRPIPDNPVVKRVDSKEMQYATSSSPDEDKIITILAPGEELITLPNGERKVYVTTVYVPAPASRFEPNQIVMPVLANGDYNYEIEPAAAKTFSDEAQVVAIPRDEAAVLSKKVQEIKRAKEAASNPKHEEDSPPALDPALEAMIKLNIFLNEVEKGPIKLISETKRNIQKEFPNMSDELIEFIINSAKFDKKFDLLRDPKKFLDKEFAKISDPIELNLSLSSDLPQEDLIKIYNLILYKFSTDLTELGFEKLGEKEIDFSVNLKNANQILEQVQLQQDTMAIVSLLGSNRDNQGLSNLIIEPKELDPNSSNALFGSSESQKVLNQIKRFSEVITSINSSSTIINDSDQILDDTFPVVEVRVGVGESIAKALEEKIEKDKSLNRNYQPRSLSSKLGRFNFELPPQNSKSEPTVSTSILADSPNISDQELQIVAETTEATNNILDETIEKMLNELGNETVDDSSIQMASVSNNIDGSNEENKSSTENLVLNNALSSAQRLKEIEDIRAIFQILGIGFK